MSTSEKTPLTFEAFKLNKQLLNAVAELGFTKPSPIQEKAIPLLLAGHDLLGIAQTGTGKTAAFALPLLMKVKYAQGNDPRALILAPTRELVVQIKEHCAQLARYTDLRFVALYGGLGPKTQIEELSQGVDIIISTPGRFLDIYTRGHINTRQIKTLIMDEADRMMDMGFMHQINNILEVVSPKKRQNMLFSATMPDKVVKLTEDFLEFPERVEISPQATTVETIEQFVYKAPNFLTKINLLDFLVKDKSLNRVIIFTKSKVNAENVSKFLQRKIEGGAKVIHANKGQNFRLNSFDAFREGNVRFLVATDVASRGIDVSMVSHVINFDLPIIYEDYVHRVGRTGRAENDGIAISFCNGAEEYHLKKIEQLIDKKIKFLPLPAEVEVERTPKEERQIMAKEIDRQKKKENPDYKGAFHEKKRKGGANRGKAYTKGDRRKGGGKTKGRKKS